jgi:hypothetical protein
MLSLAERAAILVHRSSLAAAPVPELVARLREAGVPVSEGVLMRSLAAEPERFRVLEPWRAILGGGRGSAPWERAAWVVPCCGDAPGACESERPALRRLRASVTGLGWQVDAASSADVARWLGMVLEWERFRERLTPEARAAAESATPRPGPRTPPRRPARPRRRGGRAAPSPGSR